MLIPLWRLSYKYLMLIISPKKEEIGWTQNGRTKLSQ